MSIIEAPRPLALPEGNGQVARPFGVFARPRATKGWRSWFTTIDHKKIGKMYGAAAIMFLLAAGFEALLMRLQLAAPDGKVISSGVFNQLFTMHGTTMVFLFIIPLGTGLSNYIVPLQIGARDVAFPRLNAFGFWTFLFGGLLLYSSWILGGAPNNGWYNYAPNSSLPFNPGHGVDFWTVGLLIVGIASVTGAVNLIVTIINMRAPGMTMMKIPIFSWMTLITQILLIFAIPVLTAAQFLLLFDRRFGAHFFDAAHGADPLLWEHLFWIFGHPEVYIIILPAFGVVSEILPTFSRKPLFGYPVMVVSAIAIGFMGWGVWAHHMFTSGIGPLSVAAFSVSTMLIAVPTGVKIFNWLATLWRGKLRFTTAMLYACAMICAFTFGGLSGITHATSPGDTQQHETYYVVAHFHYTVGGGAMLAFLGALYYWWPKAFGYRLSERLGKVSFWFVIIGFNMTFAPMHILGLQGMPRRVYTYKAGYLGEWRFAGINWSWNLVATIGGFTVAFGAVLLVANILWSHYKARRDQISCGLDPWDARSPEWMTPNPPPDHNYDEIPVITRLDEYWYRKYREDEAGRLVRVAEPEDICDPGQATDVHMPSPSYWPIVVAFGLMLLGYGIIFQLGLAAAGAVVVFVGAFAWALEPADDPEAPHGERPEPLERQPSPAVSEEAALVD